MKKNNFLCAAIILSLCGGMLQGCGRDENHNEHGHSDHSEESKDRHGHGHEKKDEPDGLHEDHEDHDEHEEEPVNFGPHMAVTRADGRKGIKLSEKALALLKVKTRPLSAFMTGKNRYRIPASAVIQYRKEDAVYLRHKGWFNIENTAVLSRGRDFYQVVLKSDHKDTSLVTRGGPLLRLAHLEAFGASGHGHSH